MVCVGLPKADHISSNFSQILLGPFLNSLSHLLLVKPRKFPYPGILIKKRNRHLFCLKSTMEAPEQCVNFSKLTMKTLERRRRAFLQK